MIVLENISKKYGAKKNITALKNFSCTVSQGEMVAIMGKSGSGKSTVLNIISGIDRLEKGKYLFMEEDMSKKHGDVMTVFRRDNIGFVMQHFALIPSYTIRQNISLPLKLRRESGKDIDDKVGRLAKELGITKQLDKYPSELSGGEAQRAAIARAVIHEPKVILADEPTGALDEATGLKIMDVFKELHRQGNTIIIVTHDANIAGMCERIVHIRDGKNFEIKKGAN